MVLAVLQPANPKESDHPSLHAYQNEIFIKKKERGTEREREKFQ